MKTLARSPQRDSVIGEIQKWGFIKLHKWEPKSLFCAHLVLTLLVIEPLETVSSLKLTPSPISTFRSVADGADPNLELHQNSLHSGVQGPDRAHFDLHVDR